MAVAPSQSQLQDAGRYSLPFLIYFAYTLTKGFWLDRLGDVGFWGADTVSLVVIPLLLVVVFRLPIRPAQLRDTRKDKSQGFWVPVVVNGFLVAFVLRMIFFFTWVAFARWGIDQFQILPPRISYVDRMPKEGLGYYLFVVYIALTAALVEEYIFRFCLRKALSPYTSAAMPFIVLSATTFGLAHWGGGFYNLVAAFLCGLLLASVYVKAGALRLPIVAHAFDWLRLLFKRRAASLSSRSPKSPTAGRRASR